MKISFDIIIISVFLTRYCYVIVNAVIAQFMVDKKNKCPPTPKRSAYTQRPKGLQADGQFWSKIKQPG
jgi:hypothetical protein